MIPFPFILIYILKYFNLLLHYLRTNLRYDNEIFDLLPPNLQILNVLRYILNLLHSVRKKKRRKTKPHKLLKLLHGYRYDLYIGHRFYYQITFCNRVFTLTENSVLSKKNVI